MKHKLYSSVLNLILFFLFLPAAILLPEENIIPNSGFEEWEWVPITASMGAAGRKMLAQNMELSFEYRGPLYRRPVGFALEAGKMVEGEEAYEGRSLLLERDARSESWLVVGYHGPYYNLLKTKRTYSYEICLKGNGTFLFQASIYGIPSSGGEKRYIKSLDLIKINVLGKWEKYTGSFIIPECPGYHMDEPVPAAMVVRPGDRVYVDNFIVR